VQQVLLAGDRRGSDHHVGVELFQVMGAVIGQGPSLDVGPPELIGVELGGIAGQELQVHAAAMPQPSPQEPALVRREVVPDHDDRPAEVAQEVPQELHDLLLADARIRVEPQVPAQMATPRRDGQAPDGRDSAAVAGAGPEERRLPPRGPGAADQGAEQEARFIDEDQVGGAAGGEAFDPGPVPLDPAADRLFIPLQGTPLGLLRGKNPAYPSAAGCGGSGNPRHSGRGSAA
jgi:hypothetical protein